MIKRKPCNNRYASVERTKKLKLKKKSITNWPSKWQNGQPQPADDIGISLIFVDKIL